MPLPSGVWKANLNGEETDINLEPPDQQGVFQGNMNPFALRGFWDEVSQTITFTVVFNMNAGTPPVGMFKGYLMRTPINPAPGHDVVATLAGSFQVGFGDNAPAFVLGTSRRNIFGWFAQITEVL